MSCVCFDQKDAAWPARLRATAAAQIETGPRSRAKVEELGRDLPATASTASDPLQLLWLSLQGDFGAQAMAVNECQSSLTDEGSTAVTLPPRPRELVTGRAGGCRRGRLEKFCGIVRIHCNAFENCPSRDTSKRSTW